MREVEYGNDNRYEDADCFVGEAHVLFHCIGILRLMINFNTNVATRDLPDGN
jgi:hypothetical protein